MNVTSGQPGRSKRRVMLLTKHFWPYSSDATWRLRTMSQVLQRDHWEVQVLTPRWHATWPKRVTVEEVSVQRLDHPPSNPLRQTLFRRTVCDWLDRNAAAQDWIWCDEAGLDSLAVSSHAEIVRNKIPVVVRFCPAELSASAAYDEIWQPSQAILDACQAATSVVVPNQSAQHLLLKYGVPPDRIVVCSDWIVPGIDRTTSSIRAARQSLAEVNSDLFIRSQDRVVVVPGELTRHWQLDFLIQAIVPVLDRHPNLRLWLHGDSSERERLYEVLQFHGHHRNVAMPGLFSCLETLLQAADLCLFPAAKVGMSWLLPTSIISGLPVLVASSPDLSWHLGAVAASISFDNQSINSLQAKLEHWLKNPDEHAAAVRIASQLVRRQSSNAIPRGGLAELFRIPHRAQHNARYSDAKGGPR